MGAQNTNCTMKFIDIPEDRQREAINTIAVSYTHLTLPTILRV